MLVHSALTERVIGLANDAHKTLGPGLLESVYESRLGLELRHAGIPFKRQVPMPVIYRGVRLESGYRADLIIDDHLIIEIKAVERLCPAHEAQTLTYLRMSNCEVALLLNFHAPRLKDGLKRFINTRPA
jgi:GxxExxY protein